MQTKHPDFDLSLEVARRDAMLKSDASALMNIFSESVIYTHSTGAKDSLESYIEKLTTGKLRYLELAFNDMIVHQLPTSTGVVVTGNMVATVLKDNEKKNVKSLFMTVWAYHAEKGWQLFAHQGTMLLI